MQNAIGLILILAFLAGLIWVLFAFGWNWFYPTVRGWSEWIR